MSRTWKCKCGDFQLKLHNEPYYDVQCSCHSCVASARYIDEHHGKDKGQSSLVNDGLCSQMSCYFMTDIEFVTETPEDKMGYVKVGEDDGGIVRSYTKCCGTQVFWTGAKFPGPFRNINRNNCIYNADGSKYEPANPIGTVMVRFSFDPDAIPEPKYSIGPVGGMTIPYIGRMLGYMLFGIGKGREDDKTFFIHPKDVEEIVPITW
jgi:hypothetical protein